MFYFILFFQFFQRGGVGVAVASWLVRSSPDRAVRIRALAGGSWARHLTLTVPLTIQLVYKWAPASLMLGVTLPSRCKWRYSNSLHATAETGDKRRPDEPLGLYVDLTFTECDGLTSYSGRRSTGPLQTTVDGV